jgi:hypothetical protein
MGEQLIEKIQVLISKEDLRELNTIILNNALDAGSRPEPLSTFVRNLLKREIQLYHQRKNREQKSFIREEVKEITKNKIS